MKDMEAVYDEVGAVREEEVAFSSVIKPLLDMDVDWATRSASIDFASNVALSKELRDASTELSSEMSNLQVELGLRKDVYKNVEKFSEMEESSSLEPEIKKYIHDFLRNGKREGLLLPKEKLDELKSVKKSISEKGIAFRSCLSEDTSHIWVSEEDL